MKNFQRSVFFTIFYYIASNAYGINPARIIKKADSYRGYQRPYSVITQMNYYKDGKLKSERTLKVFIKNSRNTIVKFLKPSSMKGRVLLMTDDNVWIHIPRTRNPIRLTPQQRLLGQASNGDIARMNFSTDYNGKLLGYKQIGPLKCYHLSLEAKRKSTTYQKIEYFVAVKSFKPVKAIYYAKSGKILKEGYFDKFKKFQGHLKVSKHTIKDKIKTNDFTTLEYNRMKYESLPDIYFNKNYLKRIR